MGSRPIIRPRELVDNHLVGMTDHGDDRPLSAKSAEALRHSLSKDPPRRLFVPCREHLGDVVNSVGAIRALRAAWPNAYLTVEAGAGPISLLEGLGIDQLVPRATHQGALGKLRTIARMRKARYDLAVILDDANSHVLFAKLAGIPRRAGVWRGRKHGGLFSAAVPYRTDFSETRENFDALLKLIGLPGSEACTLRFPPAAEAAAQAILGEPAEWKGHVGLVAGASLRAKRWPASHFSLLRQRLAEAEYRPVLLGGPDELALASKVGSSGALNLMGKTTLWELAAICTRLRLLVSNDTGTMHLAGAVGTRVIGLFGPTSPVAYSPPGEGHRLLSARCDCRPYSSKCRCIDALSVDQVFEACWHALEDGL